MRAVTAVIKNQNQNKSCRSEEGSAQTAQLFTVFLTVKGTTAQ